MSLKNYKMQTAKLQPVDSVRNLRKRVSRLLGEGSKETRIISQTNLNLFEHHDHHVKFKIPTDSITAFLDFLSDAVPDGDVYLFGGVLRDLALLGKKGFSSDIDLVVEGDWENVVKYITSLQAEKNKFGGYRLYIADWPVDIWNARDTWAIKNGLVTYKGIASLTETTVINWDAVLMNWRTKNFICRANYFSDINAGLLDIVLEDNPNPLGMAVRVFRHFCLRDVKKVTKKALSYLSICANTYSYQELIDCELKSYGNTVILRELHRFFEIVDPTSDIPMQNQFGFAKNVIEKEIHFGDSL